MKIRIIACFLLILFFRAAHADTIEYQSGDELVLVVDLMSAKLQDDGSSYTYIDFNNGYANKKAVSFSSDSKPSIRVVNTKGENKKVLLVRHLKDTWNARLSLRSGRQIDAAAIGINCSKEKNNGDRQRQSIIKNKKVYIATTDNDFIEINFNRIKKIQFHESGESILITLKNDMKIRGTFFYRQDNFERKNFSVCGIDLNTMDYFEISIRDIQQINTERLNPNLLCNNKL